MENKEPQSDTTVKGQMERHVTAPCPVCGHQPALDVQQDFEGACFPEYQFVCWLDDIYGNASQVIEYAAESWNEIVDAPKLPFVPNGTDSSITSG